MAAPQKLLTGEIQGWPVALFIGEGWTGRVSLVLDVHKGRASRKFRVVREEMHDRADPDALVNRG